MYILISSCNRKALTRGQKRKEDAVVRKIRDALLSLADEQRRIAQTCLIPGVDASEEFAVQVMALVAKCLDGSS
jgi:hypothetical protein